MKKEDLYVSMDGIDDEILLKYENYKAANKIVNFKKAAVIAASFCVLAVGIGAFELASNFQSKDTGLELAGAKTDGMSEGAEEAIEGETDEAAVETMTLSAVSRNFTITACASEFDETLLEEGKAIPLKIGNQYATYGFSENDDDEICYQFAMPKLRCEGENIDYITYTISKDDFTVNYQEDNNGVKENKFTDAVTTFKVDYEDQDNIQRININGAMEETDEMFKAVFEPDTASQQLQAIQKMLEGTYMTCEVTYKDGTTESADIIVAPEYHTYDELDYIYDDSFKTGIRSEGDIIITYRLQ